MTTKHSPTWEWDGKFTVSITDENKQVALFRTRPNDARLIVAAPSLLKALKAILRELPEMWGDGVREGMIMLPPVSEDDVFAALDAIKQAEG